MKSLYLSLILFLSVTVCFGQEYNLTDPSSELNEDTVYDKVEIPPKFAKGNPKSYISQFLEFTNEAMANNIGGDMLIKFTVEKDGTVTNIVAIKKLGYGLDEMAIKAIKKTSGLWKPASIDGISVRSNLMLPISFILPPEEEPTDTPE